VAEVASVTAPEPDEVAHRCSAREAVSGLSQLVFAGCNTLALLQGMIGRPTCRYRALLRLGIATHGVLLPVDWVPVRLAGLHHALDLSADNVGRALADVALSAVLAGGIAVAGVGLDTAGGGRPW
jgi:hypothetical protein